MSYCLFYLRKNDHYLTQLLPPVPSNLVFMYSGMRLVKSNISDSFIVNDVVRPYWWYVAVADCDSTTGINISHYELHFTNPSPISAYEMLYAEFSYDVQGLGQAYFSFTVYYLILLVLHVHAVRSLIRTNEYHHMIKLVTAGIVLLFLSSSFFTAHFSVYAKNGEGVVGLEGLALVLAMSAQLLMMMICILVSKGWTISTNVLFQANLIKLLLLLISVCYLFLILWNYIWRDPASTLYFYDSTPGLVIAAFRVLITIWFVLSLNKSRKIETEEKKKRFYLNFGLIFSFWFLILPFLVLVAFGIESWYRRRTVDGISLGIDCFGFSCLVFLFWPSRISEYFNVTGRSPALGSSLLTDGVMDNDL
eukprot:TRINITY_DN11050_c0_g2_i2.p1 TRINITY_DN11050_c0_g2~~TRINITY_DN11050_c0_g2_i2.p1  ORF type:complete len:363 (-),score=47.81 TRINITY_DN11050_c0_g2_i2:146-1234(-)